MGKEAERQKGTEGGIGVRGREPREYNTVDGGKVLTTRKLAINFGKLFIEKSDINQTFLSATC